MSDDPMTAILLAAGVATAATVVFTGVMSVASPMCCRGGRERRRKLRREPAKTIVSENEVTYVSPLFNTQLFSTFNSQSHIQK